MVLRRELRGLYQLKGEGVVFAGMSCTGREQVPATVRTFLCSTSMLHALQQKPKGAVYERLDCHSLTSPVPDSFHPSSTS